MTPQFHSRLSREIRLLIREWHDGCVDCLAAKKIKGHPFPLCKEHEKKAIDLVLHPRKYIDMKKFK